MLRSDYYKATQSQNPAPVLKYFVEHIQSDLHWLFAIDCGAGSGKDTKYLAEKWAHVLAIDPTPSSLTFIDSQNIRGSFETSLSSIEEAHIPNDTDIFFSSRTLNIGADMPTLISRLEKIYNSLPLWGYLVCDLWWEKTTPYPVLDNQISSDIIGQLFSKRTIHYKNERVTYETDTMRGNSWIFHMFDIIAQKI